MDEQESHNIQQGIIQSPVPGWKSPCNHTDWGLPSWRAALWKGYRALVAAH